MSSGDCGNEAIGRDSARAARVGDVMVSRPKTLPADSTVADLRRLFSNSHVTTALLVDGPSFAGAIDRDELAADVPDDVPAREVSSVDVETAHPDDPVEAAVAGLDERGSTRLIVLDTDGRTLRGLICLTRDRDGFCQGSSSPSSAG
jgi:CBS domain-containing protein